MINNILCFKLGDSQYQHVYILYLNIKISWIIKMQKKHNSLCFTYTFYLIIIFFDQSCSTTTTTLSEQSCIAQTKCLLNLDVQNSSAETNSFFFFHIINPSAFLWPIIEEKIINSYIIRVKHTLRQYLLYSLTTSRFIRHKMS